MAAEQNGWQVPGRQYLRGSFASLPALKIFSVRGKAGTLATTTAHDIALNFTTSPLEAQPASAASSGQQLFTTEVAATISQGYVDAASSLAPGPQVGRPRLAGRPPGLLLRGAACMHACMQDFASLQVQPWRCMRMLLC